MSEDRVNHPRHYNTNPSGVEAITVVEHMSFNLGNAVKYLWRAGEKGAFEEDLRKAIWYIEREIGRCVPLLHELTGENHGFGRKCVQCGFLLPVDDARKPCPRRKRESPAPPAAKFTVNYGTRLVSEPPFEPKEGK
jgi:hypothetical protein